MRTHVLIVGKDDGEFDAAPLVVMMDVLPRVGDEFTIGDGEGRSLYVRRISMCIPTKDPSGMNVPPTVTAFMVLSPEFPSQ